MDFSTMPDENLVAAWMDLRAQVEALDPQLAPGRDVPDDNVRLLTDLNRASKERERRRIPPVDDRGSRYEVPWKDQMSDRTFSIHHEHYKSREDAIARAVEIGRAIREAMGPVDE